MKKVFLYTLLAAHSYIFGLHYITNFFATAEINHPTTISEWYQASRAYNPLEKKEPIISYTFFEQQLHKYMTQQKHFLQKQMWLDRQKMNINDSILKDTKRRTTIPFVMKLAVEPGARVYLWGDLHGDIQALAADFFKLCYDGVITEKFIIKEPNCYFFFLGDTVDRGQHGPDVLALLWTFALANPNKVFIIRGNHEDIALNNQPYYHHDAELRHFYAQLAQFASNNTRNQAKFENLINTIAWYYNLLPVAAFVGCGDNFIQCCHGGLEPRYNPNKLLQAQAPLCLQKIDNLTLPSDIIAQSEKLALAQDLFICA